MRRFLAIAFLLVTVSSSAVEAEGPLHQQIDHLIEARQKDVRVSPIASDSEFLRRVSLDLAGRIPTYQEASDFLQSDDEQRREQLIERLLQGPDYPRRMQELFHVMLLERRGDHDEWNRFLRLAFEQNRSWDAIARAILNPNPDDDDLRGAAFFMTQRLVKEGAMAPVDVPGLTRDVGRLLAGIDLQCAQCHDHLTVDDYRQKDFQGLNMIFENVKTRNDVKFPAVSQSLISDSKEFQSVFEQVSVQTGPVIPGGEEIEIPKFAEGEEYIVKPDRKKKIVGVPRFSPLGELAEGLARRENELFARNIVNRLWFVMMGRGLVEPLDLQHSDNPATHPELLSLLATEFASHDFDIRWLLGQLARTHTYQRSGSLDERDTVDDRTYQTAIEKRISAEQLFWSFGIATGEFEAVRQSLLKQAETKEEADTEIGKLREANLEELVAMSEELQAALKDFRTTFANNAKEPETHFEPTVKGALFLLHDERFQKWLEPREGNLMQALQNEPSNQRAIEMLFLTVLSRKPDESESEQLLEFLDSHTDDRTDALKNLLWASLTSTESVVNH